jgi:hypothetical protein
MSCRRTEYN